MTGMQALQMLGEMRPGSLEPVQQVQGWLYALEARIRAEVTGDEMPAPEAFTMERRPISRAARRRATTTALPCSTICTRAIRRGTRARICQRKSTT